MLKKRISFDMEEAGWEVEESGLSNQFFGEGIVEKGNISFSYSYYDGENYKISYHSRSILEFIPEEVREIFKDELEQGYISTLELICILFDEKIIRSKIYGKK